MFCSIVPCYCSREVSPEYEICLETLDRSPPCKKPAGKTKKNTSNKTQKNKMKSKSVPTSRPKGSSGKHVRKKCTKENLGPAYISPPSSPSPPPVIDTANEQFSPPHISNPPNDLLCAGSSDVASGSSIPIPPHSRTTCDRISSNPSTGHPDISDLFLDPQSPLQSDHTSVEHGRNSPLNHGEDLCTSNNAGMIHNNSWNAQRGNLSTTSEISNSACEPIVCLASSDKSDAHVSIDDLFG